MGCSKHSSNGEQKQKKSKTDDTTSKADDFKTKGNQYMVQKQYQNAVQCYTSALDLSPTGINSHIYHLNRSAAHCALGLHQEAVIDAQKSSELRPDYGKAYVRLGYSMFQLCNYEGAIKAYQAALVYYPESIASRNYLKKAKCKLDSVRQLQEGQELYDSAKQHWLYPQTKSDYETKVEQKLRNCLNVVNDATEEKSITLHKQARDALILFCIQKSNHDSKEVICLLREGGYKARLSQDVLRYQLTTNSNTHREQPSTPVTCPCRVYDDALPISDLHVLSYALCPKDASYWVDHQYSVYPPTPYFSYVFDLKPETLENLGALGNHVRTIQRFSKELLEDKDDSIPHYAEVWAHHRPHCSGHQLHFDSDNEGCGGDVKHPTISSILYLTDDCGGPSLLTDQILGDDELARNGWLTHSQKNRIVVFDGSVLHGVIPGRGYVEKGRNRVTLMVALWNDIRIRDCENPCAARPLPNSGEEKPVWYNEMTREGTNENKNTGGNGYFPEKMQPERIECVFGTSDGKQIKKGQMPHYDKVFQGF